MEKNWFLLGKRTGVKVAILVADGFEERTLEKPRRALHQAGATTHIVSPKEDSVLAADENGWGVEYRVDVPLGRASPYGYDALLLPAGVIHADALRAASEAAAFVRAFVAYGKTVAAIGDGVRMVLEADCVRDRKLTSLPALREELLRADATWLDEDVVDDRGLLTSRTAGDLASFIPAMIAAIEGGVRSSGVEAPIVAHGRALEMPLARLWIG